MGGVNEFIEAPTLTELKKKVQAANGEIRRMGMKIVHPWDPKQAKKTETGYSFWVHGHS